MHYVLKKGKKGKEELGGKRREGGAERRTESGAAVPSEIGLAALCSCTHGLINVLGQHTAWVLFSVFHLGGGQVFEAQ